jgi:L-asparaginase
VRCLSRNNGSSPPAQSRRPTRDRPDPEAEVDLIAMIGYMLKSAPLAGFVVEGFTPYGRTASNARHQLMLRAVHSGLPVVRVGRGNTEGFVPLHDPCFIGGSNLTATKARLLLMACLMKFGAPPPAANPDHPPSAETAAVREKVAAYQTVFDTHLAAHSRQAAPERTATRNSPAPGPRSAAGVP